jgi:hypothetical protein
MFTRQGVEGMLRSVMKEDFIEKFEYPPTSPSQSASYRKVECAHNAIFIAGLLCIKSPYVLF